nr:bacteriocin immunity protein [Vibrio anguillarum]
MKDDISDYSQSEVFQFVNRICVE